MTETDMIFLDSILADVPEMRDRRFSGRYRKRRKKIIKYPEREAGITEYKRIKLKYIIIAALLAVSVIIISVIAGASPEKPAPGKPNISVYEMLGVTEFEQLFVTHGIEKEFYIDTDLSCYSVKDYYRRYDHLRREYTNGDIKITVVQAALFYGMPYLFGDTMQTEPEVTTINGWNAVYFETTYGTCGYIICTGEYLMCYECNSGKELLDSFVTETEFREVSENDAE